MKIDINSDIEKFNEGVVLGLSLRQTIFSGITVLVGLGFILYTNLVLGWHILISAYAVVPIAGPIAFLGFYKKKGLELSEIIFSHRKLKKLVPILFETADNPENLSKTKKKESTNENTAQEMLRKLIVYSIIGIVCFIVVIIFLIILK